MQSTDVREAAQSAVTQSKSFVARQVEERTAQLGQQIETIAHDLRDISNQLRENGTIGMAAGYVDQGADLVEGLANYLEHADSQRLVSDLESVARRQPWAIAAGALAVGFAASRFLKSSSAQRYRSDYAV